MIKKLILVAAGISLIAALTACNNINNNTLATGPVEESIPIDTNVGLEDGKIYNIGDKCPTIDFNSITSNKLYNISSDYGRVIILNFWSYDCKYCLRELPGFMNLERKYSDFISFSLIHEANTYYSYPDVVRGYIENNLKEFKANFLYEDRTNRLYYALGGGLGYPFTVILNKEGVIVERLLGAVSEDSLEEILLAYI